MRVRLLQIKQMVQTGNQLRGVLIEFGIVMPKGHHRLQQAIIALGWDQRYQRLPPELRDVIVGLRKQLAEQVERVRLATAALAQLPGRIPLAGCCVRFPASARSTPPASRSRSRRRRAIATSVPLRPRRV